MGGGAIRGYRVFYLDHEKHIFGKDEFLAENDVQAMALAAKLASERFALCSVYEVWREAWLVGRAKPRKISN